MPIAAVVALRVLPFLRFASFLLRALIRGLTPVAAGYAVGV